MLLQGYVGVQIESEVVLAHATDYAATALVNEQALLVKRCVGSAYV